MAESKKRCKVLTHDVENGGLIEVEVEYAEGDTVGQMCERVFPGVDGRLFASVKPDARIPMGLGCLTRENDVVTEYSIETIFDNPTVELRVHPDILQQAVEEGAGFVTVSVGGKTLCSWRVTAMVMPK